MNFLAHVLLAGDEAADRLGGFLGDFVKGPLVIGSLPAGLPADVAAGVALHRSIDSFADSHPAFQRSRSRVSPLRRRYAGIMVDMFYDHLLAANWAHYSETPLPVYCSQIYALLEANAEILPERLAGLLPHMIENDWLYSYRTLAGVGDVLERMAKYRLKQPGTLPGAVVELEADYIGFTQDFTEFMAAAHKFVALERERRGTAIITP